jgi:integrase
MTAAKRKRTYGRGTIEARDPGVWVIRLSHRTDPTTGKRIREARTVRGSRRDAERVLAELLRQQEAHGPTPTTGGRLTLDAWVRRHLAGADLSPRTRADNLRLWETYSTPALRSTRLRDVTTPMLESHVAALRERVSERTGHKLAPRTIALAFNVIRAALTAAARSGGPLSTNPAQGVTVKGGAAVSRVGQALPPDEMRRFLDHDPEHRLHALWTVAAYTGGRPGELLALRWEDLDLEAGILHIRRALVRVGKEMYYAACKAGSERMVPLVPAVVEALRRHRTRQVEERLELGESWVDDRLMFASEIGSALDHNNVADLFRARLKGAKVRAIRWYDLRHSFGSGLIAAGVDVKSVAQLMGHANVTLTLQHYVHPSAAAHRAAVGRLAWGEVGAG